MSCTPRKHVFWPSLVVLLLTLVRKGKLSSMLHPVPKERTILHVSEGWRRGKKRHSK